MKIKITFITRNWYKYWIPTKPKYTFKGNTIWYFLCWNIEIIKEKK